MTGGGKMFLACLTPLVLSGCVSSAELADQTTPYKNPVAVFQTVSARTALATGKRTVWAQSQQENRTLAADVHALVHRKTISADTAVQVALLNNKGLQAAYADIGINAADVWQQMLPENPKVSIGIFGIGAPEVILFRALESMVATNLQATI